MYNRYIPEDTSYTRVEAQSPSGRGAERTGQQGHGPPGPGQPNRGQPSRSVQGGQPGNVGFQPPPPLFGKGGWSALMSGKEGGGLSRLLKSLHLEEIDTGDILLLLIVLYLLVEGDDLELVIALGLTLLMGLGDANQENNRPEQDNGGK